MQTKPRERIQRSKLRKALGLLGKAWKGSRPRGSGAVLSSLHFTKGIPVKFNLKKKRYTVDVFNTLETYVSQKADVLWRTFV